MSEKVQKIAPVILAEIQKADNILLHLHPSPDGDSLGSALALLSALENLGKKATLIKGDSDSPQTLSHLPCFEKIVQKNYFETDLSFFDLFIILDASSPNMVSKKGEVKFPKDLKTVVIDHHSTNSEFGLINLVLTDYPATAQIVYDLLKTWGRPVTPEIAANLFVGVYTDTGGFKYPGTNRDTFLIAADLITIYPDFAKTIFLLENSFEPQNLAFIALALSSVEHYFNGQLALSKVSFKKLRQKGLEKRHTERIEIPNFLKSVKGWEIGASLVEAEPNLVKVSLRTRDAEKYDLGAIAHATGFGGGHKAAAGAAFKMPLPKAKKLLLETIKSLHPELGKP